jgi:antitoxin (DNA-binding transcriptional repressor) of toxin-antitoxin stability system
VLERLTRRQLSKLVALAQQGESVTIAIRGNPVVTLTSKQEPVFGLGKDQCPPVPWSAFAPVSDARAGANRHSRPIEFAT